MAGSATHLAGHVAGEAGQRHRRAVLLALIQPLQHHLVELRVGAAAQERVQLRSRMSLSARKSDHDTHTTARCWNSCRLQRDSDAPSGRCARFCQLLSELPFPCHWLCTAAVLAVAAWQCVPNGGSLLQMPPPLAYELRFLLLGQCISCPLPLFERHRRKSDFRSGSGLLQL